MYTFLVSFMCSFLCSMCVTLHPRSLYTFLPLLHFFLSLSLSLSLSHSLTRTQVRTCTSIVHHHNRHRLPLHPCPSCTYTLRAVFLCSRTHTHTRTLSLLSFSLVFPPHRTYPLHTQGNAHTAYSQFHHPHSSQSLPSSRHTAPSAGSQPSPVSRSAASLPPSRSLAPPLAPRRHEGFQI